MKIQSSVTDISFGFLVFPLYRMDTFRVFRFQIFSLEKKLASLQVDILLSDFFFSKLASLQVEILLSDFFS